MWWPEKIQRYYWGWYGFYYWKIHQKQSYISHDIITSKKNKCSKITVYVYQCFRCEQKLLTVELELLNLGARKLNMEIHHGHWKKSKRALKNKWRDKGSLFITGLYIIHKLWNNQLQIIVWRWKLMVTQNGNFFQNCYCRSLS